MKLETLQELWEQDSRIDDVQLDVEALSVPQLHSKWYKLYLNENLSLKAQEAELKTLANHRYQFYDGTLDDDTLRELGWLDDFRAYNKKILKSEMNRYLDSDKLIIQATLKLSYQKEKVGFLHSVLENIKFRGNLIKTAVDWKKFTSGI
jgi:hypothetical protein